MTREETRNLKPIKVDEIPKRRNDSSRYRQLIEEFLRMKEPYAIIQGIEDHNQGNCLRKMVKESYADKIRAISRDKKYYLVNMELSKEHKKKIQFVKIKG